MIQGIDISRHQGSVDFHKVERDGMRFCFCKATEGADYTDPSVAVYWEGLLETSMFRGLYHFARPDLRPGRSGGEREGRHFARVAKELGHYQNGCLPAMLDFEKYSESDGKENIPWIQGWLDVVENELGRPAGIYTGSNIWKYEVSDTDQFSDRTLWQVDYTKTRSEPKTIANGNWRWSFWQWSGGGDYAYHGPVSGTQGAVDVNRFNGTAVQLNDLAMSPAPPDTSSQGLMPIVDIRTADQSTVMIVQGLLLSHGFGPAGLVGKDGLPDGIPGEKTLAALSAFNTVVDSPIATEVGPRTWFGLLS